MEIKAAELASRLASLEPPEMPALDLARRLIEMQQAGALDVASLMEMAPEIEAALHQVEELSKNSQRILSQCLELHPIPHPRVPWGF